MGDFIADPSSRSLSLVNAVDIINDLKKDYGVIIMSEIHFPLEENEEKSKYKVGRPQIEDIRIWASVIDVADHFLGVDSIGQHICKALDKKATVVIGSTYPVNISYPEDPNFDIIDVGVDKRVYSPIRISMDEMRDRYNDQAMEMTKDQVKEVIDNVRKNLGKPKAFTGTFVPVQQDNSCCPPTGQSQPAQPMIADGSAPFLTEKPKKPKVGFKQEVKNLLKEAK